MLLPISRGWRTATTSWDFWFWMLAHSCRGPGCLFVLCGFFLQTDLLKYRNDLSPGIQHPFSLELVTREWTSLWKLPVEWVWSHLLHLSSIPNPTEACKITMSVTRSLFCPFYEEFPQDFTDHADLVTTPSCFSYHRTWPIVVSSSTLFQ